MRRTFRARSRPGSPRSRPHWRPTPDGSRRRCATWHDTIRRSGTCSGRSFAARRSPPRGSRAWSSATIDWLWRTSGVLMTRSPDRCWATSRHCGAPSTSRLRHSPSRRSRRSTGGFSSTPVTRPSPAVCARARTGSGAVTPTHGEQRSFHRPRARSLACSRTSVVSANATTCRPRSRPPSLTSSSRRFIPSPTATAASGGRSFTSSCVVAGSPTRATASHRCSHRCPSCSRRTARPTWPASPPSARATIARGLSSSSPRCTDRPGWRGTSRTASRRSRSGGARQAGGPRRGSAAAALIARLPERPVIDLGTAAALTGTSREAARRAIDRLVAAGVLRELTGKRRRRRWEAVGLFAVLDEADARIRGPRGRRLATTGPGTS